MITVEKTRDEILAAGLDALERELGVIDMLRFLSRYAPAGRDYSRDRHDWVDSLTPEDIQRMVEELRAVGTLAPDRQAEHSGNGRSQTGHGDV